LITIAQENNFLYPFVLTQKDQKVKKV